MGRHTRHGAAMTYCVEMAAAATFDRSRRSRGPEIEFLAIRPAWALETVYVNPASIASLTCRPVNEVPLSSLPATVLEQRWLLHAWTWRRDVNIYGGPLASASQSAEEGIGMPSGAVTAFTLPPGAKEFRASVGLDASVGRGGCAICRVYRDDRDDAPLWESGFLRGGEEPVAVGPLSVEDSQRLIL